MTWQGAQSGSQSPIDVVFFGLTGGIASGKSTVSRFMKKLGVGVVDADLVAREVVLPGSECLRELAEVFGKEILCGDASLDRRALGTKVFGDNDALARLNAITHPRIRTRSREQAQALAKAGHKLVAYEAALLVETGLAPSFRPLVVVAADDATQIRRIMSRNHMTESEARARVQSQVPLAEKVALADYVIVTSGTLDQLRVRTEEVVNSICAAHSIDPSKIGPSRV